VARTTVPLNVLSTAGLSVGSGTGETTGDTVNGHDFDNNGDVFIHVRNADGASAHNITWKCPLSLDGTPVADVVVSVGASANPLFGPFPGRLYNQANGRVNFDVDSAQLFIKAYVLPEIS